MLYLPENRVQNCTGSHEGGKGLHGRGDEGEYSLGVGVKVVVEGLVLGCCGFAASVELTIDGGGPVLVSRDLGGLPSSSPCLAVL